MKEIQLTLGMVALVDDDVYEYLSQFKWHANKPTNNSHYYAAGKINGKRVYMHRVIMQAPDGTEVDHINRNDTLDNRRANLRICARGENKANRSKPRNNTSGYIGVHRPAGRETFRAMISDHGKLLCLGSRFKDPIEAAKAYDAKARELRGEYAVTNFQEKVN